MLRGQLFETHRRVVTEVEAGKERVKALEAGERDAAAWLEVARREMDEGRAAIVREIVGGASGVGGGARGVVDDETPPAYEALPC